MKRLSTISLTLLLTCSTFLTGAVNAYSPPAGYEDEVVIDTQNWFSDLDPTSHIGIAANYLASIAIIGGFDDGTFRANQLVNRAEMAKFMTNADRTCLVKEERNYGRFWDVLEGQWYVPFVIAAADCGIVGGNPDGSFAPARNVNTAEMLAMLSRADGLNTSADGPHYYQDVLPGSWYDDYANIARKYDLFPDRIHDLLQPERELTRGEVAYALYRILKPGSSDQEERIYPEPESDPTYNSPSSKGPASIDDDEVLGDPNAPVTIIKFTDYECPFCQRFWQRTLPEIKKTYIDTGKVNYVVRDFPLKFHQNAQKAAEATECAADQSRFWEMHDILFKKQSEWTELGDPIKQFVEFADQIDTNITMFLDCLQSEKYQEEVQKDMKDGSASGISGTPSFWIISNSGKSELLSGAQPFSSYASVINRFLGDDEPPPPPPPTEDALFESGRGAGKYDEMTYWHYESEVSFSPNRNMTVEKLGLDVYYCNGTCHYEVKVYDSNHNILSQGSVSGNTPETLQTINLDRPVEMLTSESYIIYLHPWTTKSVGIHTAGGANPKTTKDGFYKILYANSKMSDHIDRGPPAFSLYGESGSTPNETYLSIDIAGPHSLDFELGENDADLAEVELHINEYGSREIIGDVGIDIEELYAAIVWERPNGLISIGSKAADIINDVELRNRSNGRTIDGIKITNSNGSDNNKQRAYQIYRFDDFIIKGKTMWELRVDVNGVDMDEHAINGDTLTAYICSVPQYTANGRPNTEACDFPFQRQKEFRVLAEQLDTGEIADVRPHMTLHGNTHTLTFDSSNECYDSDGGRNYSKKGTTEQGLKKYTDYCQDDTHLFEYDCGEEGGIVFQDGCSHSGLGGCRYECPYGCANGACLAWPNSECGNGVIETDEQCDDGNSISGDGCSDGCQIENSELAMIIKDIDSITAVSPSDIANLGIGITKINADNNLGSYHEGIWHEGRNLDIAGPVWIETNWDSEDEITIELLDENGVTKKIYLPQTNHDQPYGQYFWISQDGSSYYAHNSHGHGWPDLSYVEALQDFHLARRAP